MPICVAGMGRSGTSMIAHLLHLTGVYLGPESDLMGADSGNRDGYWENLHFVAINDAILHTAGGAWDSPPRICAGWETGDAFADARAKATLLIDQFSACRLWGWKDPRNSLTAPFWLHLIPDLTFVVCVRNPLEVACSLRHRWGFSLPLGINLWREYNQRVLDHVSPAQRIVTHYGAYFARPEMEWERVLGALHLDTSPAIMEQAQAAITPTLRGTHFTMHDLIDGGVTQAVIDLYRRLCSDAQWDDPHPPPAADADTARDWNRIWQTAPLPVTPEWQHLDAVEQERAALQRHLADVERDRDDLRQHLTKTDAHLVDVERDRDELRAYVTDIQAQLQAIAQDRDDLRQHLTQTNGHLADIERDRNDLRAYVADLAAQRQAIEQDRAALRDYLARVSDHAHDLERDRDELRAYVAKTSAHLVDIEHDRDEVRAYVADILGQLQAIEHDRNELHAYVTHILTQLQAVEGDRDAVRAYLATMLGHLGDIEQDRERLGTYVTDLLTQIAAIEGDRASLRSTLATDAAALQEITRDRDDQRARADYWRREHEFLSSVNAQRLLALQTLQATAAAQEEQMRDQKQGLMQRQTEITALTARLVQLESRPMRHLLQRLRAETKRSPRDLLRHVRRTHTRKP